VPDFASCSEDWSLCPFIHGRETGFSIDIQVHLSGAALVEDFHVHSRYRVTAKANNQTSISNEVEIIWTNTVTFQDRIEKAIVDEYQKAFETQFLPLCDKYIHVSVNKPGMNPTGTSTAPREYSICAESFQEMDNDSPTAGTISVEYDHDWNQAATDRPTGMLQPNCSYELLVQVLSASDLGPPEYRLGDITVGLFGGTASLLSAVYVELAMVADGQPLSSITSDSKLKRTACAQNPRNQCSVGFLDEKTLLAYPTSGGTLMLRVRDERSIQASIRGDPLIGEGSLPLSPRETNLMPRWVDVPISRGTQNKGSVSLRIQLLEVPGASSLRPQSLPLDLTAAQHHKSGGDGTPCDSEEEFVTPPCSERT